MSAISAEELDRSEAAWLDFLQERRAQLLAAGYEESEHPRHPDGRWRNKDGAPEGSPDASDTITLGSARDPGWRGPTLAPRVADWQGRSFDPVTHSDEVWSGRTIPYFGHFMDQDVLNDALRLNDMTLEEYQKAVGAAFAQEAADAPVLIRTPAQRVPEILADERFRSQHETTHSEGAFHPDSRRVQENMFFGYDDDLPVEQRPIYGYVDNGGAGVEAAEHYGDIRWELKPETWDRTTVSDADSLSRPLIPGPKRNPGWRAALPAGYADTGMGGVGAEQRDQLTWGFGNADYIEAQVHGGVTLDDVAAVTLPSDWEGQEEAWVQGDYGYQNRISVPELVASLQQHGITVRYDD